MSGLKRKNQLNQSKGEIVDIKQQAIDAMDEYDAQIRDGGEPTYPQCAADFLKAEAQALIEKQANQIAADEAVLNLHPIKAG